MPGRNRTGNEGTQWETSLKLAVARSVQELNMMLVLSTQNIGQVHSHVMVV